MIEALKRLWLDIRYRGQTLPLPAGGESIWFVPHCWCGAAGTYGALDLKEIERDARGYRQFQIAGRRYGCPKHPVIGACYNLDRSICVTVPVGYRVRGGDAVLIVPDDPPDPFVPLSAPER